MKRFLLIKPEHGFIKRAAGEFTKDFIDYWYLRPNVRGPRPRGKWRHCVLKGCVDWYWLRPVFLPTNAGHCSRDCASDDGCNVESGRLRWANANWPYLYHAEPLQEGVDLMMSINTKISHGIPEDIRGDIAQDVLLEVLEGRGHDLDGLVTGAIKKNYGAFRSNWGALSLDAPVKKDDEGRGATRGELLSMAADRSIGFCSECESMSAELSGAVCERCMPVVEARVADLANVGAMMNRKPKVRGRRRTPTLIDDDEAMRSRLVVVGKRV